MFQTYFKSFMMKKTTQNFGSSSDYCKSFKPLCNACFFGDESRKMDLQCCAECAALEETTMNRVVYKILGLITWCSVWYFHNNRFSLGNTWIMITSIKDSFININIVVCTDNGITALWYQTVATRRFVQKCVSLLVLRLFCLQEVCLAELTHKWKHDYPLQSINHTVRINIVNPSGFHDCMVNKVLWQAS